MKLVIAEKPMLARDIARAMCGVDVPQDARLPISGNGYTVCACAGHLLELAEPGELDPAWGKPWSLDVLPIEPHDWPKVPAVDKETGRSKKPLIDSIAVLLRRCDGVIAAGDPDDEGQLIVDELLDYLGYTGPVERVYVNDNIEKNIRRAFAQLVPNDRCRPAGLAADARSRADMCFGVNESRLATLRLHAHLDVGRVMTPTLGLVVARDLAIEGHVESYFYELSATGECEGKTPCFKLRPSKEVLAGERHVTDKALLERRKAELDGADVRFETTVSRDVRNPPLPYNLTMLIADMSKRFGMAADRTQQATQDLRDKYKAITYNRSDSQYLKSEHFEQAPAVLGQAMENLGEDWELDFTIRSKAFNDDAVTAHHGIIPQEVSVPVGEMTEDERNVYRAVCERYAMQFMRPATYEVSTSAFEVPEGQMAAKSRRVLDEGFEATFGKRSDDEPDGDGDDAEGKAPWLDAGTHTLHSVICRVERRKTAPPKPYTEGTLITDMASIAKYVTDPEVREVLKRKDEGKRGEHGGIGTTATRASIIRKLRERGYVSETKGKLHATQMGRDLYNVLPPEIRGADMTARWWLMQQEVAEGRADVECVQRSVAETFRAHMATAYLDAPAGFGKKSVGRCPVCGSDVIALTARSGKAFYRCSASRPERQEDGTYREAGTCSFRLVSYCKKAFTDRQAEALLAGKAVRLTDCVSQRTGKKFDCKLSLKPDGGFSVSFDDKPRGGKAGGAKTRTRR